MTSSMFTSKSLLTKNWSGIIYKMSLSTQQIISDRSHMDDYMTRHNQRMGRILKYTGRCPLRDFDDGKMNEDNTGNKNERKSPNTFV